MGKYYIEIPAQHLTPLEVLARRVKEERTRKGWSQDTLAEKSDVARATVVQIEAGEANARLDTLFKLAEVFDLYPSKLLEMGSYEPVKEPTKAKK